MNALNAAQVFMENYWIATWAVPAAVAVLFIALSKILTKYIFRLLTVLIEKTQNRLIDEIKREFEKPFRILLIAVGFFTALRISPYFYGNAELWAMVVRTFRSLLILLFAWGLYRLEDSHELMTVSLAKRLDLQVSTLLYPFISKALRFVTIALAIMIIAQEWNYSISGLLAGLGLGGLAFALAAKDMLSNIFAGIVIFMDKPFDIGDWIKTDKVEGTVEDINFRSVKVRTFSQAVVTIPNSSIANDSIINYSRMGKRRVTFSLALSYQTPVERLKSCEERIRAALLQNDEIDGETVIVSLDSVSAEGHSLMLYFFTKTTDWEKYLKVREKIYYEILEILAQEHVELAVDNMHVFLRNAQITNDSTAC